MTTRVRVPRTTSHHGPLDNLEPYVPAEWWRELFTGSYLVTDADVVENPANTSHDIELLIAIAGLKPEHRILDLCCGQGRHSIELARRGYAHVTGVDQSRYLLRVARQRARSPGLKIRFIESDARALPLSSGAFDCVAVMGNSFGYFPTGEDDLAVLREIHRVLAPEGTVVLDLADGGWLRQNYAPRSWEWVDQQYFVCRERHLSRDQNRLVCRELIVHRRHGIIRDQFYAETLFTHQRMEELLRQAGFSSVSFPATPTTTSNRGQDLGMMEHRWFVVASKKAEAPSPNARPVTVLLGDPTLPDPVKKNGQFNPEDLVVIDRLKQALREIPGYRFQFIQDHTRLTSELTQLSGELVLNFCDEGYRNDPARELHIPALLEMNGLHYTGAGPQCMVMCYDKALVRLVAQSLGASTPREVFLKNGGGEIPSDFPLPLIIKPNLGDGSFGVTAGSVVFRREDIPARLALKRRELPGRDLLVQEFLDGPEISAGVMGNPGDLHVLPLLEVDYTRLRPDLPPIEGHEAKWLLDSEYGLNVKYKPAQLPAETAALISGVVCALFGRLCCRDYARFDFRLGRDGQPRLLEVNPNPGWCYDAKIVTMNSYEGVDYPGFLRRLLEIAVRRIGQESPPP
ncbi:MAG: D-alanine--D-alanine ligase [Myxococcota bacterium]|nr:D-alanine--D-alanine ligase [Myxococcota bacterium]